MKTAFCVAATIVAAYCSQPVFAQQAPPTPPNPAQQAAPTPTEVDAQIAKMQGKRGVGAGKVRL